MAQILITGAEGGLGLALAKAYSDAGDKVAVLCRSSSSELESLNTDIFDGVDVTKEADIYRAASQMRDTYLDVLINNAGIMVKDDTEKVSLFNVRAQLEVNALAPLGVVLAFKRRLRKGSKVINISSRLGSITDNSSGDDYGYRMSKAAQNMLTTNLAIAFSKKDVIVTALHPGVVATAMNGGIGAPANEVADDLRSVIDGISHDSNGCFLDRNGIEIPW
jgi:NAD(P)-dependent dehydrogenase (short-subunit alcohol dehydrogenase family)